MTTQEMAGKCGEWACTAWVAPGREPARGEPSRWQESALLAWPPSSVLGSQKPLLPAGPHYLGTPVPRAVDVSLPTHPGCWEETVPQGATRETELREL